ncbi:MAG: OB-fold domain-containing protein [Desulfobacterales bacterium]|jgi:uncharacterized OB-fold protein|nr:MAG: OB-fold domain-containing protein [Desulfobacterales bacterium]
MTTSVDEEKKVIEAIPGAFEIENDHPYLVGTKCSKCGAAFFPPRYICTYCLTDEGVQKARLGNKGTLYSYTVINVASKEFNPPYAFGFVILEPEKIRIPTVLTGFDLKEELKSGTQMEMVIEKLRNDEQGNEIVSYKFRPVA